MVETLNYRLELLTPGGPSLSVDSDNKSHSDQALGTLPFLPRGEPVMDTGHIALRKLYG